MKDTTTKSMTSYYLATGVLVILVGAGAFFGGMKFQQRQQPLLNAIRDQAGSGQGVRKMMGAGNAGSGYAGTGKGFQPVVGEIISQDESSLTVKMPDGSSKIVVMGESVTVSKMADGSRADLVEGAQVTVMGTTNSDGSVTAQTVQIVPEGAMMRVQTQGQ